MKIITGTKPKVTVHHVCEDVVFDEVVDIPDIRAFIEKRNNIPREAKFATRWNPEWGVTTLEWTWFEITLDSPPTSPVVLSPTSLKDLGKMFRTPIRVV